MVGIEGLRWEDATLGQNHREQGDGEVERAFKGHIIHGYAPDKTPASEIRCRGR